jgi:hypothetical protein
MRGDVQIINPSQKWFKWSGSTGSLSYYDKEKKENVEVEMPFTFLLLGTFTTIKGYNEDSKEGIYSNEILDTTKQILTVRCGKDIVAKGLYKEIKEKVVALGGGYAQSCYIAYKEGGELVIGNITMSGSSFGGGIHKPADKNMKDVEVGGWLAFAKANAANIEKKGVIIQGKDERVCTNGAVKFYAPSFKLVDITPETDAKAIALTQGLKAYMTEYFKKSQGEIQEEQAVAAQVEVSHQEKFGNAQEVYTEMEKTFFGVKDEPETISQADDLSELPF